MYGNMDEETFRAMRRVMPITRTKMDWNLNSVRMTRQIQRKWNSRHILVLVIENNFAFKIIVLKYKIK